MFQDLGQREKILLAAVGCLLPTILLFLGVMSFSKRYQSSRDVIANRNNQIQQQTVMKLDAMSAETRRTFYYRQLSLPTSRGNVTKYQDWLEKLIRDCGMGYQTINRPKEFDLSFKGNAGQGISPVGKTRDFIFDATGTIDQILKFCYEFERMELLHKIKQLTLTPISVKNTLTGKFKADFKVQVLSLKDADEQRNFLENVKEAPVSLEEYEQAILTRNIFGPANNAPSLALSRKSFDEGEKISFSLVGRDDDKNDTLRYEILENGGIDEAKIESNEGSSRARFVSPPLEIGEYNLKIRVSDNGFPTKFDDAELKIVVRKKPEPEEIVKPEPPEPYKNIVDAQIVRISSRDGIFEVKIRVRSTGDVFELHEGGTFDIDGETWIVKKIGIHELTIETDGKLLEFRHGDFLNKPRKETELSDAEIADVATGND